MAGTPQPKKDSELPRNPAGVGETQPTSFAWLRSQFRGPASVETGDKFSVPDSNHQGDDSGDVLVGLSPCWVAASQKKVSAAACGEVVAKWLQCDAVLIKILLHSHNVTDTSPNPNDSKYRSTGWVRMTPANCMGSMISCL